VYVPYEKSTTLVQLYSLSALLQLIHVFEYVAYRHYCAFKYLLYVLMHVFRFFNMKGLLTDLRLPGSHHLHLDPGYADVTAEHVAAHFMHGINADVGPGSLR
jgi:hypothetical protein